MADVSTTESVPSTRPPNTTTSRWISDQVFETTSPKGGTFRMDGSGDNAQTPPEALLSALAGFTAVDVVEILTKRRTPPTKLEIETVGHRVDTVPRKFRHIRLTYRIDGEEIERVHAERAIDLAVSKYCTVRDSLNPEILIEWTLVLNGAPTGEWKKG